MIRYQVLELTSFHSENDFSCILYSIQNHKKELLIENQKLSSYDVSQLQGSFFLILHTKSILSFQFEKKQGESGYQNTADKIQELFPTLQLGNYSIQVLSDSKTNFCYGSIIKTLDLENQTAIFPKTVSFQEIYLGPIFIIPFISSERMTLPFYFSSGLVMEGDKYYMFQKTQEQNEVNHQFYYKQQAIHSNFSLPICASIYAPRYKANEIANTIPSIIYNLEKEISPTKKRLLKNIILPLFIGTIIFSILSTLVSIKHQALKGDYNTKKGILSAYEKVKQNSFAQKQIESQYFALKVDQLFRIKPKYILTEELTINDNHIEVICINQSTKNTNITKWIQDIEEQKWVKSVTLKQYSANSEQKRFILHIFLNKLILLNP